MRISTDEQKKAIRLVLECNETYNSRADALEAASSALRSTLENHALEWLQIDDLQDMEFVVTDVRTFGDRQRVKWRLTDSARAHLDGEKRVWFEGEVQARGGHPSSILSVEPLWLSDLDLVRFSLGDSAPRDKMLAYICENLKMIQGTKARAF
jgi:hypothetical protein